MSLKAPLIRAQMSKENEKKNTSFFEESRIRTRQSVLLNKNYPRNIFKDIKEWQWRA